MYLADNKDETVNIRRSGLIREARLINVSVAPWMESCFIDIILQYLRSPVLNPTETLSFKTK